MLLKRQWYLLNRGNRPGLKRGADARVVEAWAEAGTRGSREAIIAVLDKGFDLQHSCFSESGKIVSPHDFVGHNKDALFGQFSFRTAHGTACASIAAGNDPKRRFFGAAPYSRIMPVSFGDSRSSNLEQWFNYVKEKGAWVVSCSWNFRDVHMPLSRQVHAAIKDCAENGRNGLGAIICLSAGNDGKDLTGNQGIAGHENILLVAAVNSMDQRSPYSNFGEPVFLSAPSSGAGGWGILAADQAHPYRYSGAFGGTSAACALVAGICSFLLSIRPHLKAEELKQVLRETARKMDAASHNSQNGFSPYYGYGCIDALSAVKALL